jgi:DNA-binding transcriptional ArsR family regulator
MAQSTRKDCEGKMASATQHGIESKGARRHRAPEGFQPFPQGSENPVETVPMAIVPQSVLQLHLSAFAERLLIRVLQSVDRKGHIEITEQELIAQEGRSLHTIERHLRILRKAGLIQTRRQSGKIEIEILSAQILREYWQGRKVYPQGGAQ